ncbi:MAG TPA: DCC1-like thiol-disulfide oxidoreductase family protein [Candidatus Omnitrophota bacterium]|mgnify:CR=1 FL=1|nr:DCC1-like thiol-disulfide oxidoreductase family protein [Candidatus Omnitrophota bacterium]HQL41114.1 DCC1-like thiol-disulfide oxidoreductase family protein [Candidatus Omnitrophota bacterium]
MPERNPFSPRYSIVIFDGVCCLCNGFVDFILKHDKNKNFRLLPSQSSAAQKMLSVFGFASQVNDSVYLIQGGNIYKESAAGLRILKTLGFPFSLCYVFMVVPAFLRNMIYRVIAQNRYRWFGKKESCRLLPPQE